MSKYSYLLKNIGLMTISNFSSKILSFLLVPLYTSALSTEEYGTYDLYATTAFLLIPILSGCITDAVLRFTLDEDANRGAVFTIGVKYYIRSCLVMGILVIANSLFGLLPIFNEYPILYFAYYCASPLYDLLSQFARGQDRLFDVAVAGIICSAATVSLNLMLLVVFPLGLTGYFAANIIAPCVSAIYLAVRMRVWKFIELGSSGSLKSHMLKYGRPLVFNQISWWINNVSDRYIVTMICGASANGIYSVANKIPSILSTFQTIFDQAWTLSVVKEIQNKESNAFIVDIYNKYNSLMVIICSLLIMFNKVIARLLFANDFFTAWRYAPFLVLAAVFGSLSGLLGGIFTATKKTSIIAKTTAVGAVINILLSLCLVNMAGPLGAAIATLASYITVWAIRLGTAMKQINMKINVVMNSLAYIILGLQITVLYFDLGYAAYLFECVGLGILILLNCRELRKVAVPILSRIGSIR